MMSGFELHNKLKFLKPDCKQTVWECFKDKYMGENEPIEMFGMLVDWAASNQDKCPSENDIKNINESDFKAFMEKDRKSARDAKHKDDLNMKSNYMTYIKTNPNDTFSQYLDALEAISL